MTARLRAGVLGIGDRVVFAGVEQTVVAVRGTRILLAALDGQVHEMALTELLSAPDFARLDRPGSRKALPSGLEGLPPQVVEHLLWWERHLLDVLHGGPPGTAPLPQYDPGRWSLARRERTKAEELSAAGHVVSARTVKHYRQRYESGGVEALIDGRMAKRMPPFGRTDERVVAAMRQAIAETAQSSSRTIGFVCWRTGVIVEQQYGPGTVTLPSATTLYRLFAKLAAGTHATGSARTRRAVAARPDRPFATLAADSPGEVMQIDSTPLDVLVLLGDGVPARVELTAMIDVATRTVTAAVLRPTTKSVDASVLLARTVTPEPMRPGWSEALRMSRSVLPHRRLLSIDERLEHAAARPVIIPETIVCDHGKVFISDNFRASCRFLGINMQPARKGTPTDKPFIEKMLASTASLFVQFVAGYTGSNTDRRGRAVDAEQLWSLPELQDLLDEWIVAAWQNRPHDGLRDPDCPGRAFTPNEKYAALIEAAGYVPLALSAEDYVELLPACWRAVNAYGIKIGHRTYDDAGLDPLRHQRSGNAARKNLWEVHRDPYDVSRIWVRAESGWIMATWRHLQRVAAPFGELAWDHVRAGLPQADEAEIADAVQDLLTRAHRGPATPASAPTPGTSRRDRRVAARTATAAPHADLLPVTAEPDEVDDGDEVLAEVIPFGVFDAAAEARRWP